MGLLRRAQRDEGPHGTRQAALRWNTGLFLVEELVDDGHCPPTDYRVYCIGAQVLWVQIEYSGASVGEQRCAVEERLQATVDELFSLLSPMFDPSEVAWRQCQDPKLLPPMPRCWTGLLSVARRLGAELNVFARLDFYADSRRGPLLGEITLTPNMFHASPALYPMWVDACVRRHWVGFDGCAQRTTSPALAVIEPRRGALDACSSLREAVARSAHGFIVPFSTRALLAQLDGFDLGPWGVEPGARVALLLPSGPHAACLMLAVLHRYCLLHKRWKLLQTC